VKNRSEILLKSTGWAFHMARSDLQRRLERAVEAREPLSSPIRRLVESENFLTSPEGLVNRILAQSDAIATTRPYVRLTRIAKTLNVRIRFERMLVSGLDGLLRFNSTEQRLPRAILSREGDAGWLISVRDSDQRLARESVAHELGHILLYRREYGIDTVSWRNTEWSEAEEAVCNYLARMLLMPQALVSSTLANYSNVSAAILFGIAGKLNVPLPQATLRWLDINRPPPGGTVVLLWRQYHPFSKYLLLSVSKGLQNPPDFVRRLRAILSHIGERMRFPDAIRFWRSVAGEETVPSQLTLRDNESVSFAIDAAKRLFALRGIGNDTVAALCDPQSPKYYRPEWLLSSGLPADTFIPLGRGSARHDSVAGMLAAEDSNELVQEEPINIGSLRGKGIVHGVAHGAAAEGRRFVLTVVGPPSVEE
jgi:hypothetical protein